MAANVFAAALRHSKSESNDRNVLLALADCAWRDGVTWILIGTDKDDEDDTICRLARVSRSTASRSIKQLRETGELQTVKVRRGRSIVNVYRVLHGASAVDYGRIPFELPHRFDEAPPIQCVTRRRSTAQVFDMPVAERLADDGEVHRSQMSHSTEVAERVTAGLSMRHGEPIQRVKTEAFNVSPSRAREEADRTVREPAAGTVREPSAREPGEPAAAEPCASDREITEAVRATPGADAGSPSVVIPIAYGLPRSVFDAIVETVRERRGRVGLLVSLLRIARAERTAMLSAELLASLGPGRPEVVVPWGSETLRREEPEIYVRRLARGLQDGDLREALAMHADRIDELLELAARVRAGDEPALERDTPEQARSRWVDRHAATDSLEDVAAVIAAWDDIDAFERQQLFELAEQIRNESDAAAAAESEAA